MVENEGNQHVSVPLQFASHSCFSWLEKHLLI
uniref:Uncharacterized protein n=1 Tax=Rhizophora mucronata TaxID=61149 RepID=A0A2P2M7C7_RHIMU